ncbi:hypothetical protein AFL01nite_08900 [Aeromicrobium flavum]|uniref:Uncharacterized protein n=1 Tax=Aeromicrobium flavum TaxID=416568 RepID=A0A512HSX6_9ACTN|nr:hypothetical protein AFL01nite_08900 [Aeromicrobium flavum]
MDALEDLVRRRGQLLDDLLAELLQLAARDDRHLDALREPHEQVADRFGNRALGRREGVIEIEGDKLGSGHPRESTVAPCVVSTT